VRELENAVERAVALEQTPVVLPESLPVHVRAGGPKGPPIRDRAASGEAPSTVEGDPDAALTAGGLPALGEGFDLEARGEDFYRHYIALALERAGGVQTRAAEMLGMSFRSFRYYAKKFNLR
jgi:two-component system response regulator PilR (NtrC family)